MPSDSSVNQDIVPETQKTDEADKTELIQQKFLSMTLDEKIYSLFIVSPEQLLGKALPDGQDYLSEVNDELVSCMKTKPVSGVILFAGNLKNPQQVKNFTQPFSSRGFFVAIDEEGGVVSRIANNSAFDVPVFSSFSECSDPYSMYNTISAYLKDYGFNLDFAPVADVSVDGKGIIGTCRNFNLRTSSVGPCRCARGRVLELRRLAVQPDERQQVPCQQGYLI